MKKSKIILLLTAMLLIVSLFAVACGPKIIKVTFDGNGGTFVSGEVVQEVEEGAEIDAPIFEKKGYTLSWDKDLTKLAEDTTVTAVWTANKYTVTFNLNDSTDSPATIEGGNTVEYTYDAAMALPTPVRDGYTFGGWKKGSADGDAFVDGTVLTEAANFTLFATWSANTYTVTFNLNDSVNAPATMEGDATKDYVYDAAMALPANPVRPGYIFAGWKKGSADGAALVEGAAYKYAENFTAYAAWDFDDGQTFTITLDIAGGSMKAGEENPTTYKASDAAIILKNPVKAGYRFLGWAAEGADPVKTVVIAAGSAGNKAYTAVWEQIVYTIDFVLTGADMNGNPFTLTIDGAEDIANVTVNCGEYLAEKLPVFADFDPITADQRYAFDSWKAVVGTQTIAIDGNTVFSAEVFGEADVTIQVVVVLCPVWTGIH